ncbi:MAG TPA: hypothetical protein VKT82_16165 [Ktedonobacterales bacterium]|nr:hypothetical protein [Ktedonobacterales bacterium]
MSGGLYSIDLGLAEQVEKLLAATDADVDQYRAQLFSLVGQLEGTWVSPNKQSFVNDWVTYCNAVNTIYDVGPRMVNGLKTEINLISQAEQVQF